MCKMFYGVDLPKPRLVSASPFTCVHTSPTENTLCMRYVLFDDFEVIVLIGFQQLLSQST